MKFAARLRELRVRDRLTQQELAEKIGVSKSSVNMYERGEREPGFETMEAIADTFNVDMDSLYGKQKNSLFVYDSLTPTAQCIGRAYDKATPPVQRTVEVALEPYMDNEYRFKDELIETHIRHAYQTAAAGLGTYLDDDSFEMIALPNVPARADIAITVSGDSMEPRYSDGDIVFVETDSILEDGEIGIFCYDGQGYIKRLRTRPARLVSLNPAYADIVLEEGVSIYTLGRVVGVYRDENR